LVQFLRDGPGDAPFVRQAEYHCCLLRFRHPRLLTMSS
jgi:hypothetical protein